MNWRRIWRLVSKELRQTVRDRRMLALILFVPIFQLFIFGYAVSTDVRNISTAVLDEDRTATSRALIDRFRASGYFDLTAYLQSPREIDRRLDTGAAQLVLHIPRGFTRDLARHRGAQLQLILDGTDSQTARIINGYAGGVVRAFSAQILTQRLYHLRGTGGRVPSLDPRVRVWYNPDLKSMRYMVPSVLCNIIFLVTMLMTAMAIVKEKEIGTLEQLIVTPVTPAEMILGKTLPFLLIGMVDMALVLLVAIFWFGVGVAGSTLLLCLLTVVFLLSSLGLGIFISTVSNTLQEASVTAVFFLLPTILLSGFLFPVANMAPAIRWVAYCIPMQYYLVIVRGIFLKGNGLDILWPQALILLAFGAGILGVSALRFSKRLG